ncbi:N-acetylmuramoyl-L-alanine amidase [Hyphomicrobium sp.]|uniref:N-acetylmuramoyl-L-alanine amidase n=1 Tax=Hyphomicrobium sp. TaxID=82 RepID=UPI000FADB4C2|nr:N-acetylmuramoyl-L-alanine amidase [Hyphomicrobium sp.]MBN9247498.1 N-acetylmuramoyl-L-alanine amidase [Hyphomicrobium sp.]RUP09802.1 MAG: N-acetylmuramoyl-L-alanine amidase [Hyphomicrobium sp.]
MRRPKELLQNVAAAAWVGLTMLSPASAEAAEALDAHLTITGRSTIFELTMSEGVTAQVFTLANPYRVVIDLPDLSFRLDPAAGKKSAGLVSAFRYGQFAEHKSRVVIDTKGPVKINSANMTRLKGSSAVKLAIALMPMDAEAFGAGTGANAHNATNEPEAVNAAPENAPMARKPHGKPVIVIDPGHGGIDPGATGANNVTEKTIVLAVALQLKEALTKTGLYEVKMTRADDVFVSLDKRLAFSAENAADLFISLHADSIEEKNARGAIRGATIYTLSGRASDEQARIMAEKENASDLIAGIENIDRDGGDQVKSILIDLLKRETSNFSADFSQVLSKRLGKTIAMSRIPRRSAAFKVLKQTHAPSVLVELGYLSNETDEQQMLTAEWQSKVAASITDAVQIYFNKRTAAQP